MKAGDCSLGGPPNRRSRSTRRQRAEPIASPPFGSRSLPLLPATRGGQTRRPGRKTSCGSRAMRAARFSRLPAFGPPSTVIAAPSRSRSPDHILIITTAYGKPFTVDGFSGWMRHAISEAGLPLDCKPHGLRKAAGRLLAEAGTTAKMIMSILGHTTLAEAERYTEEADQAGLAEDALIKLEGHKANRIAQTTSVGLGKTPKTRGKSVRKQ